MVEVVIRLEHAHETKIHTRRPRGAIGKMYQPFCTCGWNTLQWGSPAVEQFDDPTAAHDVAYIHQVSGRAVDAHLATLAFDIWI